MDLHLFVNTINPLLWVSKFDNEKKRENYLLQVKTIILY